MYWEWMTVDEWVDDVIRSIPENNRDEEDDTMARKRITIEQWITDAMSDPDKGKPCSAFSLVHVKGVGQEEIYTKQLTTPVQPKQLAEFFIDRATGFAQDLPGIQTFRMLAFYGSTEPQAALPFTVVEGELTGGGESPFAKHEPTQAGLLGQLMKHNEQIMGMMLDLTKSLAVQSIAHEAEMRKEVNDAQMIVRDVIMNMRKEAHEMRMTELRFQQSMEDRRLIGKALPTILNQLTGREIVSESHADTELLDALAAKVKPAMLEQLVGLGILNSNEAALLAARFAKSTEERKKELEALKTVPPEEPQE
jgi:hypothetical protein